MPVPAEAVMHQWTFHRIGGLDQVSLATGEDVRALPELDQTLSLREHPERGTVLPEFHQAELRELRDGSDRIVYSVNMASRSINVVRFLQG